VTSHFATRRPRYPRGLRRRTRGRSGQPWVVRLATFLLLLAAAPAWGFDFARYEIADLDALLEHRRPETGVNIYQGQPYRLTVTLLSHGEPCDTGLVKRALVAGGIPKAAIDGTAMTQCIKVRSGRNKDVRLYIQDLVASHLPAEAPLGRPITLYALHAFTGSDGPGLVVSEFRARNPARLAADPAGNCGCGWANLHPGTDYSAPEGTAVRASADGVVVKVEDDEHAVVETPTAGHCGRYIVIKHTYPNGRAAFTRYAELGRSTGADGKPLAVGARIATGEKIGEVGSAKTLHFELRPVEPGAMDTSPAWTQRYARDPAMEWSRYPPVDPAAFDLKAFATRPGDK
jgi:murein DD-endopeptidase MepM/ murein hydrolase activator NlpD